MFWSTAWNLDKVKGRKHSIFYCPSEETRPQSSHECFTIGCLALAHWNSRKHKEKEKEVLGADSGTEILEKLFEEESTAIKMKVTEENTWTKTRDQAKPPKLQSTLNLDLG